VSLTEHIEAELQKEIDQLKAQIAVLRKAIAEGCACGCNPADSPNIKAALAHGADRAFQLRLRVLERIADKANDCAQGLEMGVRPALVAKVLRQELAELHSVPDDL
jgi:hypothetical protein